MGNRFKDWIIYEDEKIIAINKPAGISALDERNNDSISILRLAKKYSSNAQLCHRIDKDTSGALLIAKDNDTYKECAGLFRNREIKKTYLAISEGRHHFDDLKVDLPLDTTARGKAKVDKKHGKPAETNFTTIKVYGHYSLISCTPVTGRLHQIRVHLVSQNAVIVADDAYGGQMPYLSSIKRNFNIGKGKEETPMIHRLALHAHKLEFELNGKNYDLTAPQPKDFSVFIKLLDKFDTISL